MIPDYQLSILEAKAIAASGRMKEWRITPMTHRANVLKLWVRRPERAHWYEAGDAIGTSAQRPARKPCWNSLPRYEPTGGKDDHTSFPFWTSGYCPRQGKEFPHAGTT